MYGLRSFDMCSTTTVKYEHLSRPRKMIMPNSHQIWKRAELVMPMRPHSSIVGDTVCLGDFGLTIKAGTQVTSTVQGPVAFCPPERFHGEMPTSATDMWSYLCIFAELYIGRPLLCGPGTAFVVDYMVDTFGPLPESWKGSYTAGATWQQSWYDPQRRPRPEVSLETRLAKHRPEIGVLERQHVLKVLQRGFSYVPQSRFTASQLLGDSSFMALMNLYGL
jgi:serine/threonine protein kinase